MKPAVLELGGKAPLIILDDADLDQAVNAAAFGSYANSGQICMSTERIIVDNNADAFVEKFAAKSVKLPLGDPRNGKSFTKTFTETRQNEIASLCQGILDKMQSHLADLGDYAVTSDMLDEAQVLIDTYDDKVPQTRTKGKEKKASTQDRDGVFDLMLALMNNKILKITAAFKDIDGAFYNKIVATTNIDATATLPTQIKRSLLLLFNG